MRAKRRLVRQATALEELSDRELVLVKYFGKWGHPRLNYQVQPGDGPRADALLHARGYYMLVDGQWRLSERALAAIAQEGRKP